MKKLLTLLILLYPSVAIAHGGTGSVLFQDHMGGGMMMGPGVMGGSFGFPTVMLWMIIWIVFWLLVLYLATMIVRAGWEVGRSNPKKKRKK